MKRNTIAKDLRTPKYRMRIVRSKKGRGSWHRTEKHKYQNLDEFSFDTDKGRQL